MDASSTKKRHRSQDDEDPSQQASKKKSTTTTTTNLLQDIPTSQHYQVSYMHQQTITHVTTSIKHGMVITGSVDGVVKFWKRTSSSTTANSSSSTGGASSMMDKSNNKQQSKCLEFVKSYTSHIGPLLSLITSQPNGDTVVSIGYDNIIKFYDVATFDVSGMIRTNVATNNSGGNNKGGGNKKFRLGKHAVLIEREDIYLLVSTRAPNREEWSMEEVHRKQQEEEDDSDDDGPLPQGVSNNNETTKKEEEKKEDSMVPPGSILLFSGTNLSSNPLQIISYHVTPVTSIAYHSNKQWLVSGDVSGVLEVWNLPSISSSSSGGEDTTTNNGLLLPFESKLSTDLYALIKKKTYAIDIAISEGSTTKGSNNNDGHFAIYSSDRKIRLFSFKNCKLVCIYDERLKVYDKLLSSSSSSMGIDAIEYGKRAALEREMEDAYLLSGGVSINPVTKQSLSNVSLSSSSEGTYHQSIHISFDNTGKYLLLPTIVGIKVINIVTHRVVATIGKGDASALRFITVVLCPGDAKVNQQMQLARMGGSSAAIKHGENYNDVPNDSLLVALAYGKRRFYTFSHYDPLVNNSGEEEVDEQVILARDVLNEAPDASDLLEASHLGRGNADGDVETTLTTASKAILRTTHGDITIKLFPKETPKTIQNFIGHAQSGYYDNVIFHRIIQGFMLQTGDPLGDGTGGESIWGGEFEDEIRRDLRHDRPFTVSMANAGPSTNGSQFFITTVPTPWLDNKHTVFGRVTAGMEVVMAIEGVETDDLDRPLSEVKILSVDVS